jgi:hypothetical protein
VAALLVVISAVAFAPLMLEIDERSESEHMESDDGAVELDEMERGDGMSPCRWFGCRYRE